LFIRNSLFILPIEAGKPSRTLDACITFFEEKTS